MDGVTEAPSSSALGTRHSAPRSLHVLDLGLQAYGPVLALQERLVQERLRAEIPDTLLLVEHPPVVTLGRGGAPANLRVSPEGLQARGVEFFAVSRGGDATYHAPGQLVGYPVFDLRQHGRDVLAFCRGLEAAIIGCLADFGIAGESVPGKAGVWVGSRKICSLGISVRRWVTFHGFALNVATDLAGFHVIRPCGEEPGVMISMAALLDRAPDMGSVRAEVGRRIAERFSLVLHSPGAA